MDDYRECKDKELDQKIRRIHQIWASNCIVELRICFDRWNKYYNFNTNFDKVTCSWTETLFIQLTVTVLVDLIVYRTCVVSLNLNATDCLGLQENAGSPEASILEAHVEPHAGMIVMAKSLVESLLPAMLCLFIGTWSDRLGQRPICLATFWGKSNGRMTVPVDLPSFPVSQLEILFSQVLRSPSSLTSSWLFGISAPGICWLPQFHQSS